MYASRTTQFIVGLFALLGIVALAVLSFKLGNISILPAPSYELYANFDNIGGLKPGDEVDIAGVQIGKVLSETLVGNEAHVTMQIHSGVPIDDEAIASIRSTGIIGGKYISIQLGPSTKILTSGGRIMQTESAFSIENAVGQLINNVGTKPDDQNHTGASGGNPGSQQSPPNNPPKK
ncbi:MAG: outer membrane lipid asymmetry maintenance protein MlaD [Deltaproteobacteria bacterium]|jgi:phospholipid/cholesterol/gamma-HCH transport system substrate-binding protein|nr:outer membrane lipid asymmetry maintenance protein MlaD [Deltaproteobacteria bacterium]